MGEIYHTMPIIDHHCIDLEEINTERQFPPSDLHAWTLQISVKIAEGRGCERRDLWKKIFDGD